MVKLQMLKGFTQCLFLSMSVWIPDKGELQMGCFALSRKRRLTWPPSEATSLLDCPIRLSQVLENTT